MILSVAERPERSTTVIKLLVVSTYVVLKQHRADSQPIPGDRLACVFWVVQCRTGVIALRRVLGEGDVRRTVSETDARLRPDERRMVLAWRERRAFLVETTFVPGVTTTWPCFITVGLAGELVVGSSLNKPRGTAIAKDTR